MQNKYKLRYYDRQQVLGAIKGYENYKRDYAEQKDGILSFGSKNYSEHIDSNGNNERVYITGGGNSGSQTEDKALRLAALDESHGAKVINAVETAQKIMIAELSAKRTYSEREKIVQKLYESCRDGNRFNFDYSGINSIQRTQFYQYRLRYIYIIAEILGYI